MSSIPISPFSDFLSPANAYNQLTPPSDYTKRLRVCLVSPGLRAVATGPLNPVGYTGAGLLGILHAGFEYGRDGTSTWPPVNAVKAVLPQTPSSTDVSNFPCNVDSSNVITFRTPQALILALNRIHENANDIIRMHLPQSVDAQGFGIIAPMDAFISGFGTRNKFKFLRDYLFPGTYTGNTGGILPVLEESEFPGVPPVEDYQGNGITGAFAVYDDPSGTVTLSRTGLEFLVAYELLLYGVVLMISPTYNPSLQNIGELNLGIDCYITLAQSDNIVGVTAASGNNRSTFGSLEVSYQSGNTFNFTHGCSSGDLVTIYNNIVNQNNFLQQLSSNALLFHNGLSGADFNLTQKSANGQYTDLFRLPVLDGITGSYQNIAGVAGLTAIKLNDAQLSKTICVAGYKERPIFTSAFGGKLGELNARIPLTVDAIGALARAKAADAFYSGLSGLRFGLILNPGTLSMALAPSDTTNSTRLKSKRINYYVASQQGLYLGSDYVGVTGAFNNSDRVIIPNLAGIIETEVRNLIEPVYVSTNKFNNPTTRSSVTNDVINAFTNNSNGNWPSIRNAIDVNQLIVTCDGSNNTENSPMLTIDITVFPIATTSGTDISQSFIGALTVRVTLGG